MPEEAVRWGNPPRRNDVPPPWDDSSDENEEERLEPWLGTLHAARQQPKNTAVPKRGGGMQDRTYVPLRAGRHLQVHGVVTYDEARGAHEMGQTLLDEGTLQDVKRAKHADGSPQSPPSQASGHRQASGYLL